MGSYAVLAVIVVVTLVAVFLLRGMGGAKEGFGGKEPSPKAKRVTAQAAAFFETHSGPAQYQRYRDAVEDADPVQLSMTKKLHRSGKLSPEEVERFV